MARPSLRFLLLACTLLALLIPAGSAAAADGSGWSATAASFRGQNGVQKTYDCPKYGQPGSVWGTDVYTDDSSVCAAAVHAGFISLAGGGTVTIEIRPGEASYAATVRNRISSNAYGSWSGSFVVVGATPVDPGVQSVPAPSGTDPWQLRANAYRSWVGAQYEFNCPANGRPSSIWGTDIYTDDSSVCTAAVHAGLISVAKGGKVVIEMVDGQSSYRSTTRRGIKSNPYPAWGGSFIIIGAPGGPDEVDAVATGDVTVNGRPFTSGKVKYGSTIDVTRGTLKITAKSVGNVLTFGDGLNQARFKLNKLTSGKGRKKKISGAELALNGGAFDGCTGGSARASGGPAGKVVRSLWTQGKGKFRTKGKYASATVRGTKWLTSDQCDGTLTNVTEGSVLVRDLRLKKNVLVRAGGSYLAKAP